MKITRPKQTKDSSFWNKKFKNFKLTLISKLSLLMKNKMSIGNSLKHPMNWLKNYTNKLRQRSKKLRRTHLFQHTLHNLSKPSLQNQLRHRKRLIKELLKKSLTENKILTGHLTKQNTQSQQSTLSLFYWTKIMFLLMGQTIM